jgi:LmbE family N-acetylglucosaminyl deacetylase
MGSKKTNPPTPYIKDIWRSLAIMIRKAGYNPVFRRCYVIFALLVLLGTTLLWAVLGAHLQSHNADQLSDPYLFSNLMTLHGASFPGSHTFLLKWPIFWLIGVFGVSSSSLLVATVGVVLATVATLTFVLYKIDRRPLVFGTICLGLSLALLLVPAQPYAGGLLPVNMAMLTTRNIEYAVYIAVLALFARAKRLRSWDFAAGVLLLALLIASDKLFLSLSMGGALIVLIVYATLRVWNFVTFAVHWFIGSVIAVVLSAVLLDVISATRLTHLANEGAATPYGVVSGVHNVVLGVVYGVLGLFTNAGANPVYDNLVLRQLPGSLAHRLWSLSGPAYVVAAIAVLYALLLAWRLAWESPRAKPRTVTPVANLLALALIWSTAVAIGVFVVTNHYYAVDARYLTIGLFALVVTVSVGLRTRRAPQPETMLAIACCLMAAIVIAVFTSIDVSRRQNTVFDAIDTRNDTIATTLKQHKVELLVGDYWRVLPVKLAMGGGINTMPMATCTQPEHVLSSSVWQPNLRKTSFAYLLTLSGSLTNFPNCSISQVVSAYGHPNATEVISGSLARPTEALLFYDRGSHRAHDPAKAAIAPTTILPITTDQLAGTDCAGPTIMNFVAHEDDDLLFMNPDLLHEIKGGDCVRTIFLTAGNDGKGESYWLSRQLGAEAAYNEMLGTNSIWIQRTVQLNTSEYITVANPRDNLKISLIFFDLPDGNLTGQGFPMSHFESLAKLQSGAISTIQSVDGQSTYTAPQLVKDLAELMVLYHPSEIHTQADVKSVPYPDHSDHIATGKFTQAAATVYDQEQFIGAVTIPVKLYVGYPIHGYPANVSGSDLEQKEAAFFVYAQYDGDVCRTIAACQSTAYGFYLTRQYGS